MMFDSGAYLNMAVMTDSGMIPLEVEVVIIDALKTITLTLPDPTPEMAGRVLKIINKSNHSIVVWYDTGFDGQGITRRCATFNPAGILSLYVHLESSFWRVEKEATQGVWFA